MVVIHINGMSGSGRSTLGRKFNIPVIDTDEIESANCMKLLQKNTIINKKFWKELAKMNKRDIDNALKTHKNIIFIGNLYDGIRIDADYGFFIKVDTNTLWRRYNMKVLTCLHNNFHEIQKLFNSNTPELNIHVILMNKYKIKHGFECASPKEMENMMKYIKSFHAGYKYMDSDSIYKKIRKLLQL